MCSPGEIQQGKAPAQLTPPSTALVYKLKEPLHAKVVEHVSDLGTVEVVWSVKKNQTNDVTPCGMALVAAKQFVCQAKGNIVS